jgi:hypothetical protein
MDLVCCNSLSLFTHIAWLYDVKLTTLLTLLEGIAMIGDGCELMLFISDVPQAHPLEVPREFGLV